MPSSHRVLIFGVVGMLALVGAAPNQTVNAANPKAATRSDEAGHIDSTINTEADATDGHHRDLGCPDQTENRQSDLCAQWKAADAAHDSARWAWWQMIIAVVGVALGAITMIAAIAAAIYARRAAIATEASVLIAQNTSNNAVAALQIAARNADAAELAVHQSQKIGEAQTRAYVTGLSITMRCWRDGSATIVCKVKNFGQSPAFEISWTPKIQNLIVDTKQIRNVEFEDRDGVFEHYIATQTEQDLTFWNIPNLLNDYEKNSIKNGNKIFLSIDAEICGFDVFRIPIKTEERFTHLISELPEFGIDIILPHVSKVRLLE